jgi:hypothetical protein
MIRIRLWDVGMDGDPSTGKDRHDTAPYNARNRSTGPEIITRRRCVLVDDWNGKCKDLVQDVESDEKDQHGCVENTARRNVSLYITV